MNPNATLARRRSSWRTDFGYPIAVKVKTATPIDSLKPLPSGADTFTVKEMQVFTDDDLGRIMLSLVSLRGTVNIPLSRKTAAKLVSSIASRLAEQPQ
jgi:hypothetical protein